MGDAILVADSFRFIQKKEEQRDHSFNGTRRAKRGEGSTRSDIALYLRRKKTKVFSGKTDGRSETEPIQTIHWPFSTI